MAIDARRADTFPKLLIRNAREYAQRPAIRHKDLGIWQTWTWAQVLDDVRAYAVGLHRLGVTARRHRRDRRLQPAEALLVGDGGADARRRSGAGLCRRGRRRTRLCARARRGAVRGGRGSGAGRQDPVGRRSGCRSSSRLSTTSRAACATTTTASCMRSTTSSRTAARRSQAIAALGHGSTARSPPGKGADPSIILYTSGTTGQSKGVVLSASGCINAAADTVAFDKLTERGRGARLSAARLGRRPLSQLRAGPGRRLLPRLPGERRDRRRPTCARSARPSISRRRASSSRCSRA